MTVARLASRGRPPHIPTLFLGLLALSVLTCAISLAAQDATMLKALDQRVTDLQTNLDKLKQDVGTMRDVLQLTTDVKGLKQQVNALQKAAADSEAVALRVPLIVVGLAFAIAWWLVEGRRADARKEEAKSEQAKIEADAVVRGMKLVLDVLHTTPTPTSAPTIFVERAAILQALVDKGGGDAIARVARGQP